MFSLKSFNHMFATTGDQTNDLCLEAKNGMKE